jgi:hypothetical protein
MRWVICCHSDKRLIRTGTKDCSIGPLHQHGKPLARGRPEIDGYGLSVPEPELGDAADDVHLDKRCAFIFSAKYMCGMLRIKPEEPYFAGTFARADPNR